MLTKDFERTYIPGVVGTPEIPYRAAYTVCHQPPAPGHWETRCTRLEVPNASGIRIPPNGELVTVRDPNGAIDPLTGEVKIIDVYIRVCTSVWVTDGPPGPTVCTTFPEQPYVPATPSRPAKVETTMLLGWNAGANSVQSHDGDCACTFNMDRVTGAICGFTAELDDVASTARFSHAIYFHGGKYQVVERGIARTPEAPYQAGDEFRIQRTNGVVTYIHERKRVLVSRVLSAGAIYVGGALFASSDTIGGGA